jgi:VWFA-related protein
MKSKLFAIVFALLVAIDVFPQTKPQTSGGSEATIRISTQLVQLDAVVTDKTGKVVKGLSKNDFELFDGGKRQEISFFEFVDAEPSTRPNAAAEPSAAEQQAAIQGAGVGDVRRIFAFVIDDLTMQPSDLVYVRDMLTNFVDNRMQPTDLVAIVRVVGGESLLQQFTTDKNLLKRTILKLTPRTSAFNAFNQYEDAAHTTSTAAPSPGGAPAFNSAAALDGNASDINSETDDATSSLRAFMTLGTAGFLIDGMKELPGRKAMVLVSGGLPALSGTNGSMGNVSYFLDQLADRATRAGVAINTLDIRGLSAQTGVASFDATPGKSAVTGSSGSFGRLPDPAMDGTKIPFDVIDAHMGLRQLSAATGGIAELNRNDFNKGLDQIVETNSGYYLLAYTPSDAKFNGDFRKVEIKVKGSGYKVLGRRGYVAREEHAPAAPATKRDELLAAIKSPLAKRDVNLDAALFYTALPNNKGAVGIGLAIDPSKLKFETVGDKQEANCDVEGFVFDELGKLRGGFDDTLKVDLTPEEMKQATAAGIPYSRTTEVPPGIYQIRIAVRDQATGAIGTTSRYLEVPDISRGHLSASSLLIGSVPVGETKAGLPTMVPNRAFSRKQDLRYALVVYNPKMKDGASSVTGQVIISQNGKVLLREPPKQLTPVGGELVKIGQFGLGHVARGRFTLTVLVTDTLSDKKAQTMVRATDFNVID